MNMVKGPIEIEIANYMSYFNKKHLGRGPKDINK